jgi:cytochrome c oxidase cbb3-type subunit IV
MSTYELLARIAQSAGLLLFMTAFFGIVAYALWPKNADRFDAAARLPLSED